MKLKIPFFFALILSGAILGCTTATRHSTAVSPKVKLAFMSVDSQETDGENGRGENAVDGDPASYWHTQWLSNSPALPHEIVIELLPPSFIKGFTYLPRQDESDHGKIKDYEFYVSDDGENFGKPVDRGMFAPGKEKNIETFEPIKCRFIKLKAISEINNLPWVSAAEIGVIQNGENTLGENESVYVPGSRKVNLSAIVPNTVGRRPGVY